MEFIILLLIHFCLSINQKDLLLSFYTATEGEKWFDHSGWATEEDYCTWKGITCDENKFVTGIALQGNNLGGTLPSNFGYLSSISSLDLSHNHISGPLPISMVNMKSLAAIGLRQNNFSGPFPLHLREAKNLMFAHLDFNNFEGPLPEGILHMKQLKVLGLTNNKLKGPIPATISELTGLTVLGLGGNELTGKIPIQLRRLTQLVSLDLSNNKLSGTIPDIFKSMHNLADLSLFSNQLEGEIPESITNLPKLSVLSVNDNKFTKIPSTIGASKSLFLIDAKNNKIDIEPPQSLRDDKTSVVIADLSGNPWKCNGQLDEHLKWTGAECHNNAQNGKIRMETKNVTEKIHVTRNVSSVKNDDAKVQVEYWGITKCPDLIKMENTLFDLSPEIQDIYEIRPYMLSLPAPAYRTKRWSMHGQSEVYGNILYLCAYETEEPENPGDPKTKWKEFAKCEGEKKDEIPSRAKECTEKAALDWDKMKKCVVERGATLLEESQNKADTADYHAVWSPTLYFDKNFKCLYDFKGMCDCQDNKNMMEKHICDSYKGENKPAYCNNV
ncbi:putative leucine-rich repeat containing protein [Monocercomonoides exilis]|uniref:putative leucine-rich repeat containing protein n=1 Tax=Monocercomonoides exilis TaxID=2049356 RepID=UPI003559CB10|nr:putative leucine-rich repeat containing protein [Monocercomonoides exilis]|eukprot:MONOS_2963.1-p1 / transcript=MONOS_2963.1 / gene=MONOS_2963 / organism=Monocercomonoides_exilis_PA203 / gene_product=leucine-rich repeat containing protein / transcript_product=leucine-rich repeat containing protein / location=Mono_scaffold00065:56892-59003(-) / protein_length=554 / sequence_SO=supercontig / SO=protein_coding / is_pseudo=false